MRPSHTALFLSTRLPLSHPAIYHMGRSALFLWMDSIPQPAESIDSAERGHSKIRDCSIIWECILMYLLTVPPGTNASIVVSNSDPAYGTQECSNLNIKNVCQTPFKTPSFQKHLKKKANSMVCPQMDAPTCWVEDYWIIKETLWDVLFSKLKFKFHSS